QLETVGSTSTGAWMKTSGLPSTGSGSRERPDWRRRWSSTHSVLDNGHSRSRRQPRPRTWIWIGGFSPNPLPPPLHPMGVPADPVGVVGGIHRRIPLAPTLDVELPRRLDPLVMLERTPQVHVAVGPPAGPGVEGDLDPLVAAVRRAAPVEGTIEGIGD